jgi:hypothetical protein
MSTAIPSNAHSESILKPLKPDAWNGRQDDVKPFRNCVINYLTSFSGTSLSKQLLFILSLTTHSKASSWTNTRHDWLANDPDRLPQSATRLLDSFVQEFGDRNAALTAQQWLKITFQGS